MWADFAEVGTADFSEICLLVSVASEARAKASPESDLAHVQDSTSSSLHGGVFTTYSERTFSQTTGIRMSKPREEDQHATG